MDERRNEHEEERVEDLDVPESESEDVKGGQTNRFMKIEGIDVPPPPPPKP